MDIRALLSYSIIGLWAEACDIPNTFLRPVLSKPFAEGTRNDLKFLHKVFQTGQMSERVFFYSYLVTHISTKY